jgi:hypothetical protein
MQPRDQEIANKLIQKFDKAHFQRLIVRWIVDANLPFTTAEHPLLHEIFSYLSPSVAVTEANITADTVHSIAVHEFKKHFSTVKNVLLKAPGQIHIAYDGWTSRNKHALYGVVAVFRGEDNKPKRIVLGLPELTESHTGRNIAAEIIKVIREYGIGHKLGYFTLDNASNNDSSMEWIGQEFEFEWKQRRVRCIGHIINLVVRALLFGKDDKLEQQFYDGDHTAVSEHEEWRKRGPVGKLHNFCKVKFPFPCSASQLTRLDTVGSPSV